MRASSEALYDRDYLEWTQAQVRALHERRLEELDLANLEEELSDLGRNEELQFESRLEVLLAHLLKWLYQSGKRTVSWENTIDDQRDRIRIPLKRSPSLSARIPEAMHDAYRLARRTAGNDMKMGKRDWDQLFPRDCPWSAKDVLDENFYPRLRPAVASRKSRSGR